ncbi:MAG: hypothetical protein ACREO3_12255 [Arenimonas sp.]
MNVIGPGFVTGVLVGFAIGLAIAIVVGALLLRLSVRWLEGFAPSFGRSALAVFALLFMSLLVNGALGFTLQMLTGFKGLALGAGGIGVIALLSVVVLVLVASGAVHWLVPRPDGDALSMPRAMRIAAVFVAACLVLYMVLATGVALLMVGR